MATDKNPSWNAQLAGAAAAAAQDYVVARLRGHHAAVVDAAVKAVETVRADIEADERETLVRGWWLRDEGDAVGQTLTLRRPALFHFTREVIQWADNCARVPGGAVVIAHRDVEGERPIVVWRVEAAGHEPIGWCAHVVLDRELCSMRDRPISDRWFR